MDLNRTVPNYLKRDFYLGTVDGLRATEIYRKWIKDWFDWTVGGKGGELMNKGSKKYSEMVRKD